MQTINRFLGVDLKTESTDAAVDPMPLRRAEGMVLYPTGSFGRTPPYERLWQLGNLRFYMDELGLTAADNGVCILARNEGIMFLLFYDCLHQQSLGSIYAGPDPESDFTGPITLIAPCDNLQVLAKGLANQYRWSGERSGTIVVMGNSIDPNMALETSSPIVFRPLNDQMRPLVPIVSMVDPDYAQHRDATVQAANVVFTALEPDFQPQDDPPYMRSYGNYVKVAVVQGIYSYFTSTLSGTGTLIDPFIYTVICPNALPTEDELVNFIQRDANAQGVVGATLATPSPQTVQIFSASPLVGGISQLADTDIFKGPYAAACVTYCKRGVNPGTFSETMPSPVQTCQLSDGGRLVVTINPDITAADYVSRYDTIRIYAADMAAANWGLSSNYYGAFLFALEVPNAPGSYVISPSMLQTATVLSVEGRTAPPCCMFQFAGGRLHMSGNPDFPLRRWFTAVATRTNPTPEGIGIFDYTDQEATVVDDAIVALGNYRGEGVVFLKQSAYPFDTAGTTQRYAIKTGALNSRTLAVWTNGAQYYIGRDYNIYTLTQPVTDARSLIPDFNLPAPQIGNYLQQYVDNQDTHFAHSVVDTLNKNWWFWLRNTVGGMSGFVFDFETAQLTGPFISPQFMCAEFLEQGDTRMVGMDLAGNIFWMDVKTTTTITESFDNDQRITLHDATDALDVDSDGFNAASAIINGNTKYIRRGSVIRLQSPWLNFTGADMMKGIYAVNWQCVQGSSGLVWVTVFNEKRQSVTRYYGDVMGRDLPPRVLLKIKGNFLQFMLTIIVGDDLPFAVRNLSLEQQPQGKL